MPSLACPEQSPKRAQVSSRATIEPPAPPFEELAIVPGKDGGFATGLGRYRGRPRNPPCVELCGRRFRGNLAVDVREKRGDNCDAGEQNRELQALEDDPEYSGKRQADAGDDVPGDD